MSAKVFFSTMTTLAIALFSCSRDAADKEEEKTTDRLSVVATGAIATYSEAAMIVLTEDDIESYNGKTGRIALQTALTCDDFFRRMGGNSKLAFYLGEELLFEAALGARDPDAVYDEPVFEASCGGDESVPDKYFLYNGFPYTGKSNPGWDTFIRYLSDAGKLTEAADPVIPVTPKDPDRIISAITADDITSYNLSTTEIVFTGFTVQDLHDRRIDIRFGIPPNGFLMPFYLGEKLLFEAKCVSPASSVPYHDLTFTWYDDKFYLSDRYPDGDNEEWKQLREANAQKRKAGWDAYINYLSDAGKIVR
jgi:hypothetical protein